MAADTFLPVQVPPGLAKGGTDYSTKGHYNNSQLVRYYAGTHQPVGGWTRMTDATGANLAALTGVPRACLSYRPNPASSTDDGAPLVVIGTHQKLYAITGATSFDITPSGFTAGVADSGPGALGPGSYGAGNYGVGNYGSGSVANTSWTNATTWSLDIFGQYCVAMATSDGVLYVWQNVGGTPAAVPTWGLTFTGTPQTSGGANTVGTNLLTFTSTTLTGTILHGQTFIVSGTTYTAWADATAAANTISVTVTPPLAATYANGTNVTGSSTQAPTGRCTFVTPEKYLVVGGAQGVARRVMWADQASYTQWGPLATNSAGFYDLPSKGRIVAGKQARNQTLIWTDSDLWAMTFTGTQFIYRFDQVGDHCGAISPNAMAVNGSTAMWMSQNAFYVYDGATRQIPCAVADFVFNNINLTQAAKIWTMQFPEFGEMWWFYPSSGSNEIDSYVMYSYAASMNLGYQGMLNPIWYVGTLKRSCGSADQAFNQGLAQFPVMVAPTGEIYNHESGSARTGEAAAFLQTGPVELDNGGNIYYINGIVADEKTLGDTTLTLSYAMWPGLPTVGSTSASATPQNASGTIQVNAFGKTQPVDLRIAARQVAVGFYENNPVQWRVGTPRLMVQQGGGR